MISRLTTREYQSGVLIIDVARPVAAATGHEEEREISRPAQSNGATPSPAPNSDGQSAVGGNSK